jgi:mannose-6-phosphate isomerase-like protein (cupin superfamily)
MSALSPGPHNLMTTYARLRGDTSIEPLPVNAEFWPRIMSGALGTFHHEYLVTMHEYAADWPNWEMHPNGEEIVCLLEGRVTFLLERDGSEERLELAEQGAYVLVPRGTWHTAKTSSRCRMLFITAGEGTQHRHA